MNILVVYAHPVATSFVGALHETTVRVLAERGHTIDDCDLYAEGFDPVLSTEERLNYHDTALNRAKVASYVDRLKRAEALVFVHPVWNFGPPAILKGYFDRVFLPGVSFDIDQAGTLTLTLGHIRRLGVVCTYGADRWRAFLAGNPPRRFMTRVIRAHIAGPCDYLACYDMNHTTAERRAAFLQRIEQKLRTW